MTIPEWASLNDMTQMAKIKSGWKDGPLYRNISAPQPHNYVDGLTPDQKTALGLNMQPIKASVFGGKTFNERK